MFMYWVLCQTVSWVLLVCVLGCLYVLRVFVSEWGGVSLLGFAVRCLQDNFTTGSGHSFSDSILSAQSTAVGILPLEKDFSHAPFPVMSS